jgi:DNA polymerase
MYSENSEGTFFWGSDRGDTALKPFESINDLPEVKDLRHFRSLLHTAGCRACNLGFQPNINGCCVSRGDPVSRRMIIGEAPGKKEDATRSPFTGPAGLLLDDIWEAVGWKSNNWYLTNVVLCRPVAPRGSGKQNLTPRVEQRKLCRPYLDLQIRMLKPKIIVTLGKVATDAILGPQKTMGSVRGKLRRASPMGESTFIFPMYHPAAILHAKGTDNYDVYRRKTWDDIRQLKKITEEYDI